VCFGLRAFRAFIVSGLQGRVLGVWISLSPHPLRPLMFLCASLAGGGRAPYDGAFLGRDCDASPAPNPYTLNSNP